MFPQFQKLFRTITAHRGDAAGNRVRGGGSPSASMLNNQRTLPAGQPIQQGAMAASASLSAGRQNPATIPLRPHALPTQTQLESMKSSSGACAGGSNHPSQPDSATPPAPKSKRLKRRPAFISQGPLPGAMPRQVIMFFSDKQRADMFKEVLAATLRSGQTEQLHSLRLCSNSRGRGYPVFMRAFGDQVVGVLNQEQQWLMAKAFTASAAARVRDTPLIPKPQMVRPKAGQNPTTHPPSADLMR